MNRPDIKEDVININNAAKLEMVLIPPGTFLMGDPLANTKPHGVGNEMQHKVTITQPFYLGKYVVTETQWLAVMSDFKDPEPEKTPDYTRWGFHDVPYTFHVRRGGSFKSNPENIASFSRNFPDIAYNSISSETSFRLARTVIV